MTDLLRSPDLFGPGTFFYGPAAGTISDSSLLGDEDAGGGDQSWQSAAAFNFSNANRRAPAGRRAAGSAARSAGARSTRRSHSAHAPPVAVGEGDDEGSDMEFEVLDDNISNRTLQRIRQYEDDEAMARRLQAEFDAELARAAGAVVEAARDQIAAANAGLQPDDTVPPVGTRRSARARSSSPTPSSASPPPTLRNLAGPSVAAERSVTRRPLPAFTGAASRRRVPLPRPPLPPASGRSRTTRSARNNGPGAGSGRPDANDSDDDDDDDDDGFGFNLSIQELLAAVNEPVGDGDAIGERAGGRAVPLATTRRRGDAGADRAAGNAGGEPRLFPDIMWQDIVGGYRVAERASAAAGPSTSTGRGPAESNTRSRRGAIDSLLAAAQQQRGEEDTSSTSSSDNVQEMPSARPGPSRVNRPINLEVRGARSRYGARVATPATERLRNADALPGRRANTPQRIFLDNGAGVSIEIAGTGLQQLLQQRRENANMTMDYDQMLRLTEALGEAVNPSLRKHEMDRIPVIQFTASMLHTESTQIVTSSTGGSAMASSSTTIMATASTSSASSSGVGGANSDLSTDSRHSCQICMCEYEVGDMLKLLPCFHRYHSGCIDEWFGRKANCPICRVDVRQHLRDPQNNSADDDDDL